MLVLKIFFDYAYFSPENFFDRVKILGHVGQNMTTPDPPTPPPPPPNVDGFATSLTMHSKLPEVMKFGVYNKRVISKGSLF
jgi:hypothetical protein